MSRRDRERAILEIVAARAIHTQEELVEALAERGIEVTQTTVSRDIRRLGLVKVPAGDGYRYAPPDAIEELHASSAAGAAAEALRRDFADFVRGVERVRDTIVISTDIGAANAVAVALDAANVPGVAATLAGDDTIFVLTRTDEDLAALLEAFRELREG